MKSKPSKSTLISIFLPPGNVTTFMIKKSLNILGGKYNFIQKAFKKCHHGAEENKPVVNTATLVVRSTLTMVITLWALSHTNLSLENINED